MDEPTPNILATVLRPLLREMALVFGLPDGILGIAIAPAEARTHTYFAEFVGPGHMPEGVRNVEADSSPYQIPSQSLLSDALLWNGRAADSKPLAPATLDMGKVRVFKLIDIERRLTFLFGNSVPDPVLMYRAWLKRPVSLLYYVPKDQKDSEQWQSVIRAVRFVAYSFRLSMVLVCAADRMDPTTIQPLIDCLPTLLSDQETRLAGIVASAMRLEEQAKEDLRNTAIEVDFVNSKNEIVFSARRPDGQPVVVARINCKQGTRFGGKAGVNLIVCDTKGKRKMRKEKQTLALLILNKAISPTSSTLQKINYEHAYRFFHADDPTLPGEDVPLIDSKKWQNYVGTRMRRARGHLQELLGANTRCTLIEGNESNYALVLDVTKSKTFADRLEAGLLRSNTERTPGSHTSSDFMADLILQCSFNEGSWYPSGGHDLEPLSMSRSRP